MLPDGHDPRGSTGFEVKVEVRSSLELRTLKTRDGTSQQKLNLPFVCSESFPVAISEGSHPFPSRTRKLSPPEPMVLRGKPRGRVGRRRVFSGTSRPPVPPGAGGRSLFGPAPGAPVPRRGPSSASGWFRTRRCSPEHFCGRVAASAGSGTVRPPRRAAPGIRPAGRSTGAFTRRGRPGAHSQR